MRVVREKVRRVRGGLVDAVLIGAREGHAWRAGEHQPWHARLATGRQHVASPENIGVKVLFPRTPDTRLRCHVENDFAIIRRLGERGQVREIAGELLDPECVQFGVPATGVTADIDLVFAQQPGHGIAEETTTAGDQRFHACAPAGCFEAQTASFSRKILAL